MDQRGASWARDDGASAPERYGETETRGGTPHMAKMRRRDDDTSAEGRLGENRGGVTAHGAGIHLPSGNFPEARKACPFPGASWTNMERS